MMQPVLIGLDAFWALPESALPSELIHGAVFRTPVPDDAHQKTALAVVRLLLPLLPGGELRIASSRVVLGENVVQPDLFWVSPENRHCVLVDGKHWQGTPDLMVEILSPGREQHDTDLKFDLYEQQGVREYWIVRPELTRMRIYTLRNGAFVRVGEDAERLPSALLGVEIDPRTLFL